jgi:hypothetical protein
MDDVTSLSSIISAAIDPRRIPEVGLQTRTWDVNVPTLEPEAPPVIKLYSTSDEKRTKLKNVVFWDVTPCDSSKNRRFAGT